MQLFAALCTHPTFRLSSFRPTHRNSPPCHTNTAEILMKELLAVYDMEDIDNNLSDMETLELKKAVLTFLRIWSVLIDCVV